MRMLYLGIDPGLAELGWAVIKDDLYLADCGKIVTLAKTPLSQRLAEIESDFTSIVAQWKPERIAIEYPFFDRRITSAGKVLQAVGVLILSCGKLGYPEPTLYHQSTVKACVAHGTADKYEMIWAVQQLFGIEGKLSEHEADAIAVAYAVSIDLPSNIQG